MFHSPILGAPVRCALVALCITTACSAANEPASEKEEAPDTVASAVSSIDCGAWLETGYENGNPYPIEVVTVDGKPVEKRTADAYWVMAQAAEAAGVQLWVSSGFRTMGEQEALYACGPAPGCCCCNDCHVAAVPGTSNHQSGEALDLGWSGDGYGWLRANAGAFGFAETVSGEPWHWEYQGGGPGGGPCGGGCSDADTNACAQFGCGCVAGQCSGGYCDGSGCTQDETNACGQYGCACVDHHCSGGACGGTGCTARETNICAEAGLGCYKHACQ